VVQVRGEGEAALDGHFRITGRVITSGASCRIVGHDLPQVAVRPRPRWRTPTSTAWEMEPPNECCHYDRQ
jgi:hypothetical protein